MAYDENLAARIRDHLIDTLGEDTANLREQKMFGGLGFMLNGHMTVAAAGKGGMMLRLDPDQSDDVIGDHVQPMEMRGRVMTGWLLADDAAFDDPALGVLIDKSVGYIRTLPPKG